MSCCCCMSVDQGSLGIVESCGKFTTIATPGLQCVLPWYEVVQSISTQLQRIPCAVESKTKDNVFVDIDVVIQYQVLPEKAQLVHYRLESAVETMMDYVRNSIRSKIPLYKLEALYVERGTIAQQLKDEVDGVMDGYGIDITSALIEEIKPAAGILEAMDEIQQVQRLRVAALDAAETKKMTRVRAAEAECTARRLAGEGLAQQRKAIVAGLMTSVKEVRSDVPSLTSDDAATMLLMNQYYDTLRAIAEKSSGTVLVWETNGGLEKVAQQMNQGLGGLIS